MSGVLRLHDRHGDKEAEEKHADSEQKDRQTLWLAFWAQAYQLTAFNQEMKWFNEPGHLVWALLATMVSRGNSLDRVVSEQWLRKRSLPLLVFAIVALGATGLAAALYRVENARHEAHFELAVATLFNRIETGTHILFRPVQHVAAVFEFEAGAVSEEAFQRLARSIPLTAEPGLLELQWISRQTTETGQTIFPVRYRYSPPGKAPNDSPSRNLREDPVQRRALLQAQQQQGLSISPWYREAGQIRFRATVPVYLGRTVRSELLGFVSGLYGLEELLQISLCSVDTIDLYVGDPRGGVSNLLRCSGSEVRLTGKDPGAIPGGPRLSRSLDIDGTNWSALAVAKPGHFQASPWIPFVIFLSGSAFGAVLAAFLSSLHNREAEVRELIRRQTDELRQSVDNLRHRTGQLEAMNADLEEFAYVASHDLKAPLRAVSQLASWIDEDAAEHLDPETQERLRLMRERVIRMDSLIEGILAYSRAGRITTEAAEAIPVEQIVREVVSELSLPEGFRVEVGPLPILKAQAPHLRQIFQNLIANAVDHHDRPGVGTCWVRSEEEAQYWRVEVADDGPGIPPHEGKRIFRMFTSLDTKPGQRHTGIGLAVVRKLVRSYGGQIDVTDNSPRGAVFRIWWPK